MAQQQHTSHTLADDIRQKLISAIIEGEIPQGAKVSEVELANRYGVSRGPLREAMRDLEGLRLVERKPHAGVRVVALNCEELREIFTIREALEGMAARLAATEMSEPEIRSLRKLLELHESKVRESQGQSYFQQHGDLDFHLRILTGSRNRRLYKLMGDELYRIDPDVPPSVQPASRAPPARAGRTQAYLRRHRGA